jgi:hypothetical protein
MTTYAQITNGQIVREAPAPTAPGYGPDGHWHDYTDPAELAAYLADGGWVAVTEPATAKPADTATTYYVREVSLVNGGPVAPWVAKPKSAEQQAAEKHAADLATLRSDIVTKAITWLEADSQQAQTRATAISNAVTTVQTRKGQAQAFAFNGANVAAINTQLNNSLKPLLIDMLDYIIGLGNITSGLETWRGGRVDPALVWLARHGTDTTD